MSLIYTSCVWAVQPDIEIPSVLLEQIESKIREKAEGEPLVWRHFGGLFAPKLNALLSEYPQASSIEKATAVLIGAELSFRLALGSFFCDFEEIQAISMISFETIVRARLGSVSAKELVDALELGLEKMPLCQFSFSPDDALQWRLLSSWVRLSFDAEEKIFWRPEIFLPASLSGLGETWLSEQLEWTAIPSLTCWYSALSGLEDIYHRHVKAADKRLRPDQIVSIEIELPHFLQSIPNTELQKSIAHYCTQFSWEGLGTKERAAQEIISRIQIRYSSQKSLVYWEKCFQSLPNLFAGVSEALFAQYQLEGFSEKRQLRKHLRALRYQNQDWQKPVPKIPFGFSSSVVIYTSRGGKWTSLS